MAVMNSIDMVETAAEKLTLTVTVERVREFNVRMWLVVRLLAVVGWVSPVPVVAELVDAQRH